MKKSILTLGLLYSFCAAAQQQITGNISIPTLQSVSVIPINERPVDFSTIQDYSMGKTIPAYCRITVKSNTPWRLSATLNSGGMPNQTNAALEGSVSIQVEGNPNFVPLTNQPKNILYSTNSLITNEYTINLKIDPKLNISAEALLMNISFMISAK